MTARLSRPLPRLLYLCVVLALASGSCSGTSDPSTGGSGGGGGGGGGGSNGGDGGDDQQATGTLQVITVTSGEDLDGDGYVVSMAGSTDRAIGANGSTVYSDLATDTYTVTLDDVADNCAVDGSNPTSANVTEGATVDVTFELVCQALPRGTIEVTTSVSNNFDPDGFDVHVEDTAVGRVDVDASASFIVPAGSINVELREIAPNCFVTGDNPRSVELAEDDTQSLLFEIACESPPDGRITIIGRHPSIGSGVWGVSTMNSDGSGRLFVFDCAAVCLRPRWSPDGSEIVFAWPRGGLGTRHLYIISQDGRSFRRITGGLHVDGFAAWSPDGEWIVFARLDNDNTGTQGDRPWRLYKIRTDGTDLVQFPAPPDGLADLEPHWSPDGSKIAFVRKGTVTETGELVEMLMTISPDGTVLDTIVPNSPVLGTGEPEYFDRSPTWSPDGTRIAFDRRMHRTLDPFGADYRPRAHSVAADGTDLQAPGSNFETPTGLPSCTRFVVEDGNGGLFVMPVDGSGITLIDRPELSAGKPDWGP